MRATKQAEQAIDLMAELIGPGGRLEHQVQQLAEVLRIWREAPLPERRFLRVDHQAAEEILHLIRAMQQQPGRAK